jgi:tetratricopeptide (TPR) repeat protein
MSEAPHGGHDSRPGENPQASVGQRDRGTADARGDVSSTAPAWGHERDNEAHLGAPNSHSRLPDGAVGVGAGAKGREAERGLGPARANGGQQDPGGDSYGPGGDSQGPGGDSYAWYRRGLDLLSRGSPAAAAELLERAAAAEPGARSIREALARAQFDAGRYAQAADNFRQNVEAIPSDDYAHFGLGLALARGGNPAAAAEHLALAAAMRPDLAHYTEALRGVRATLAARMQAGSGAQPPSAPDGE